ncbi:MAG: Holliday junction branch migration protein RuvA [Thermoleophilia bacterium]|jgi:Holliday junction DNA helicase RuvA
MIERLTGIVAAKSAEAVILDVNGVGFRMEVSAATLKTVAPVGTAAVLFTHLHVREDLLQLFGFSSEEERELFRLFLTVSRIGPKVALAALSYRRPPELRRALAAGDVTLLSSVPGIGRRTAERLVVELKEKVGETITVVSEPGGVSALDEGPLALAKAALMELGYASQETEQLLAAVDVDQPVETIIRQALGRRA